MDGPEESHHRASQFPASPMPSVIVGPNRLPGNSTTSVATRLGHTPMASSVVVLGGNVGYNQGGHSPSPSTATGPQSRTSNALIDAHPSGATYAAPVTATTAKPFDPNEDDPLEHTHSIRSGSSGDANSSHYVIAPSIQVRSEFPTITPNAATSGSASGSTTPGGSSAVDNSRTQPLTCIVIVELASRRTGPLPGQQASSASEAYMIGNGNGGGGNGGGVANGHGHAYGNQNGGMRSLPEEEEYNQHTVTTRGRTVPSRQGTMMSEMDHHPSHHHHSHHQHHPSESVTSPTTTTPTESVIKAPATTKQTPVMRDMDVPNPAFASVAQDLHTRIADWKGHPMSGLGALQMFDILSVRRDALVREFYVYLFK